MPKTKQAFLIIALFFSFVNSKAQSSNALDSKLGYYNFTLGDSYKKWSSQLQLFLDGNTQKSYIYKNGELPNLYGNDVKRVLLTFVDQKLTLITIELSAWDAPQEGRYSDLKKSLDKLTELLNSYKILYGNPTENQTDIKTGKVAIYWEGKFKYLLLKLTYLGVTKGSRITIDFGNKIIMSKSLNNY